MQRPGASKRIEILWGIYRLASICGDGGLVEDLSSLKIG